MIVVDASAMVEVLLGTDTGREVDDLVLGADSRHAPHLLDIEVAQVLRRFVRAEAITAARARQALEDLCAFPMRRHAHVELLERMFELRANFTAYDAVYLALAEALDATLVTCDEAMARAPRRRVRVRVFR